MLKYLADDRVSATVGWAFALFAAITALLPDGSPYTPVLLIIWWAGVVAVVAVMLARAFIGPTTKPVLAAELALFAHDTAGTMHVLLVHRTTPPSADRWALPGGPVLGDETAEQVARRYLANQTGLTAPESLHLGALWDDPDRGLPGRTVSAVLLGYAGTLSPAMLEPGDRPRARWIPLYQLGVAYRAAFDHEQIIRALTSVLPTPGAPTTTTAGGGELGQEGS